MNEDSKGGLQENCLVVYPALGYFGTRVQGPALWKVAITRSMRASYLLIAMNEEGVFPCSPRGVL